MQPINPNYTQTEEKLSYILSQLRNTGIIIETEDGMKYLKGEEFDSFFGLNDTDKMLLDSILIRNIPYTEQLAKSMSDTKQRIMANIMNKAFKNGPNP